MPVVEWKPQARADLLQIIDYIASDNVAAAQDLKDDIEEKAARLSAHPKLYKEGRVVGTREMVVRRNYVVVYAVTSKTVPVLRVLHAAQQWPAEADP